MTQRTIDYAIIIRALDLLRAGILASAIPDRLMDDFSITPEKARELAAEAIKRHKRGKRGRLDTKPIDKPG